MIYYLIIFLAIITRFVPHVPNFAPITAIAIFSAVYLPAKHALALPLLARFISDLFLGFFAWPLMIAVYGSHAFGVLLGLWIKSSQGAVKTFWFKVLSSGFISAIVFFVVTNFAFLYSFYPHNLSGIIQSYINALPFFRGTALGDIGYTLVLFTLAELAVRVKASRRSKAPAWLGTTVH